MTKPFMALLALALAVPASAQEATISQASVKAHETFLASEALHGRGSATRDEAIAAAYVAAQFEGYGLKPAPGMSGYLQTAKVVRMRTAAEPRLSVSGVPVTGVAVLSAPGGDIEGKLAVARSADRKALPRAEIVVVAAAGASASGLGDAAAEQGVKLLIVPESDATRRFQAAMGGQPRMPVRLDGDPERTDVTVVTLPPDMIAGLAKQGGAKVSLALAAEREETVTTNAIGYLPGTDPAAGVVLLSAHLDHLGVRPDGVVMPGANDDASGTTAVLELARALAAGRPMRRGVLFVCYGSEEVGGLGSRWFGAHPPVPLASIVANLEIEMIGAQDPKLPPGTLMMTGYDRSDFGPTLKARGALVAQDPYPEQNFFERSDNYQLALEGVVAHTVSGLPLVPTYHSPTDTVDRLDLGFMTRAIQSLVAPLRWLADGDYVPRWTARGRPVSR